MSITAQPGGAFRLVSIRTISCVLLVTSVFARDIGRAQTPPPSDRPPAASSNVDETPTEPSADAPKSVDESEVFVPRTSLRPFSFEVGGVGRAGGVAGHVWAVPAVGPALGGGGRFRLRYAFSPAWEISGSAGAVVGAADDGSLGFGYNGFATLHLNWIRLSWLRLQSATHAGLTGFLLFPIPTFGFTHSATFYPVNLEFFRWNIRLGIVTDVLLVVPHLGADVATGVEFFFGPVVIGAEVRAEGDLLIAVIANQASALAVAELSVGFRF